MELHNAEQAPRRAAEAPVDNTPGQFRNQKIQPNKKSKTSATKSKTHPNTSPIKSKINMIFSFCSYWFSTFRPRATRPVTGTTLLKVCYNFEHFVATLLSGMRFVLIPP